MAADTKSLAKLESDFLSGRNPRAYIPLCQTLRRQGRTTEALDICQRGVSRDQQSLAGSTLLARLLIDIGRYEEGMAEIQRAESFAAEALGLLTEKARCQIRLNLLDEAEETLKEINDRFPMNQETKLLGRELRQLKTESLARRSRDSTPKPQLIQLTFSDVAETIRSQTGGIGDISTIAILDLDSGRNHIEGDENLVEVSEAIYQDYVVCCDEMDQGIVQHCLLELQRALVLIYRRDRRMAILSVDPSVNYGKLHHRVQSVLQQHLRWSRDIVAKQPSE